MYEPGLERGRHHDVLSVRYKESRSGLLRDGCGSRGAWLTRRGEVDEACGEHDLGEGSSSEWDPPQANRLTRFASPFKVIWSRVT